jgi:pimeloyl-ACP methyl ester carboxylesterase
MQEDTSIVNRKHPLRADQEVRPIPGLKVLGLLLRGLAAISPDAAARCLLFLFSLPGRKARHYREDELLQAARREVLDIGSGRIRIYTWGSGERAVLLLHGWQSRGTALRYFVPSLLEAGFRVVAMDAPGHGESGGYRMTLPGYAAAIRTVDKERGPFEGAITHSFGGRALTFALGFLDHEWRIRRLVMLAAPGSLVRIFQEFFQRIGSSESLIRAARATAVQMLGRPVEESEIYNLAPRLKVRLLLIHDEEDDIVPISEAERIANAFAGARLQRTRGYGHYRLAKAPEVWAAVRSFLEEQD